MTEPPPGRLGSVRDRARALLVDIAWFSIFHPRTVLLLTLAASVVAGLCALRLRLSTDVEDLLPRVNLREVQAVRQLLQGYGATEPIVVAIEGQGDADVDDRIDLALALRDRLAEATTVRPVSGLFGEDPWALLDSPLARALLLYLRPEEVRALAARFTAGGIDDAVAAARERLRSPLGPLAARLAVEDPLELSRLALAHVGALKGRLTVRPREGVLVTRDGGHVLLFLRPLGPATDMAVARRAVAEIETASRAALAAAGLEGSAGIGPRPARAAPGALHVGLTGAPVTLLNYRDMLANDALKISIVSYVAQLFLFLVAFRRAGALLVAGTSMLVGALWALGVAGLTIGEINIFTAGSIGILCGLTIDFSVHIYNRYLEEAAGGRDMLRAFARSHGETGLGILASVGVMVWAFVAAGTSSFRGLAQLGVICGAGLVLSLLASLTMIPALTALGTRWRLRRARPSALADFGLTPLLGTVVRRPRTTVALGLACAVVLTLPAFSIRLEEDLSRFRPRTAPSLQLQDALARQSGALLQPVLALVPGRDDAEVLERSARVEEAFDALARAADGPLAAVLGPARVVPPPSRQAAALAAVADLRAHLDPAAVEREILGAFARNGFRVDERARHAAARVRTMLERDHPVTAAEAREGPLAVALRDMILALPDGTRLGVVSAYPRPGARTPQIVPALAAAVAASGVHAELAGARVVSQAVRPLILRDGLIATLVSAAGVTVILALSFRRTVLVLLTLLPLALGLCCSVGVMALCGIEFNLVTVAMLPLIIGIALDNGIHVVHRYLEGTEDVAEVLRHTGRGVVLASLTTVAGFAALLFADYPGLVASGVLAMLGTGIAMFAALTVLPALLMLVKRR